MDECNCRCCRVYKERERKLEERVNERQEEIRKLNSQLGEQWVKVAKLESTIAEMVKVLESAREKMSKQDCGDNSCLYVKPKTGMRTNGGCRCFKSPDLTSYERHIGQVMPQAIDSALRIAKGEK